MDSNKKYHKIIALYENNDITGIENIYKNLDKENEKMISAVIETLLLFREGNIKDYEQTLLQLKKQLEDHPDTAVETFYHLRKHLLHLYNEEYADALAELRLGAECANKTGDNDTLRWICFQELEISTFYLRNFRLSRKFIDMYNQALTENPEIQAYFYTVRAYISSYDNKEESLSYVEKVFDIIEGLKDKTDVIYQEIVVRICFSLLNLNEIDRLEDMVSMINPENPEKFLIESYYQYKLGNFQAALLIFEEAYNKFYCKKRYDEYWLKFFLLAADVNEKLGDNVRAAGFYDQMFSQLDYLFSKLKSPENMNNFREYYKSHIYNALLFYRKQGDTEKLCDIIHKYEDTLLEGESEDLLEAANS